MLKVLERKTNLEAVAVQLEDGRFSITAEGVEPKELAESTFKRLYTVTGEVEATEEAPEVEQEVQEESAPESDAVESLETLLADAQEVVSEMKPEVEVLESSSSQEEKEARANALEALGLNIKLRDWYTEATRGGKTEKIKSVVEIKDYIMEITEYDGFITDVVLFKENDEAPENDPDAKMEKVYRSVKMSLKDTLEWMGLGEDDMKLARKEITSIRKQVKSAHAEQ